ncbi:MAG: translation initiation factor IF-2 [Ruminiclostridium sp.]|nr:translation initiation factor IF-2 [Ruminiclostridium sp.]
MEKVRVYELAKELNTTSKRLMEKLAEINVVVKNHMSLLEDHELDALYKHIGVIKHEDKKVVENHEEKKVAPAPAVLPPSKPEAKKDVKSAPRIIRTTEIIINSKNESRESSQPSEQNYQRGDVRGGGRSNNRYDNNRNDNRSDNRLDSKRDFVRFSDSNSGLRAGFVRDNRPDYSKETKPLNRPMQRKDAQKDAVKAASGNTAKEQKDHRVEAVKAETGTETVNEIIHDQTQNAKEAPIMKKEAPIIKNEEQINEIKTVFEADTVDKASKAAKTEETVEKPVETDKAIENIKEKPEGRSEQSKPRQHPRQTATGAAAGQKPNDGQQSGDRRPQYGDRPQYQQGQQGERRPNQGDRPQYQQGERRPYQGDRPQQQGDRPQFQGNRPQYGDRRPQQGDRPQYQQGDRPQYQQGERRPYQGDRPQYQQGERRPYQGDRPQYQQGDRPQYGDRKPYQSDRPQYQRNEAGGSRPPSRPGDRRPQSGGFRPGQRPLDIPKPELSLAQKEEMTAQRSEVRREFVNKDIDKDVKREQKRELPKSQAAAARNKRFKPQTVVLNEKKGVSEVLSEDFILDEFYSDEEAKKKKSARPRKDKDGKLIQPKHIPARAVLTSITIPDSITVKELSETLKKTSTEVIKKLMVYGMMATLNQEVDFDTATIVAEEFGVKTERAVVVNEEDILFDDEQVDESKLQPRPPVVVVMGHVDHGKTSLLDAIRSTNVIDTEAGGITQHIGAYTVKINDRNITFLDTPGHEAFTAMRARGAQVTDIAILVVAADDGVMPQTIEAINHAKAARVSIIVAINKIDKPGANPDRVKQELAQQGLVSEEWGGDVICVNVSAKKRENIDRLLEMVLLTADILELKADPDKQAKGTVIEAKLDKNRGPIATVLVQRGTLNIGDSIVTGTTVGRIRAMNDDKGVSVREAGPSTPVEILGMPDVPEAGELFYAITDEKVARQLAEKRKFKLREQTLKASAKVSLEDLYTQIKEGKVKDLNIIVKADVQGSVEAVKQSFEKLSNDEVRVNIIHGGVGAITESDVILASVSNAIIIGFNVRPGSNVTEAAENANVDLRLYSVIYNAIEDVQAAMKGMLEPTFKEVVLGHTEIRQIFKVSGVGTIAGCYVTDGKIIRNSDIRVIREGIVVHEGKLASLKRFKDDAREVTQGFECGLSIEKFNDIKEGDIIETYAMEEVAR